MKRAAGLALLLIASFPAAAGAAVIYVRAGATGANTGTSWTDAYTSLQTALSAAVSSDEIWVAAAPYKPTSGTDRTLSFAMKNGVGIYGGFAGTESARGQADPAANVTILSGDIGTSGLATDNSYHVVAADATVTASGVLDGFTVTGGRADGAGPVNDRGGGLYADGGNPSIARCVFSGNFAGNRGGGMRVASGSATLTACIFQSNSASSAGGGLSAGTVGALALRDCVFRGNSVGNTTGGGAIEATDNTSAVNCVMAGNSPNGIVFFQGNNAFVNCTVTGNSGYGSVFFATGNAIANSVLWGDGTGEIFLGPSASLTITYSDVQGGFGGTGNISANPLFVNAASGDLRLSSGSPAVDAASNAAVPVGVTADVAGLPRFFDDPAAPNTGSGTPPLVDMGAHERVPLTVSSPASQSVCAGAVSFSVTASGSGPFSYRWRKNGVNLSNGGAISGVTTSTLTINPTGLSATGNYDVVVTDAFSQMAASTAAVLTVNAIPGAPAASNNGPICAGATLQLSASTIAGASYSWTGPNGFSSTLQNPTIASATTAASGTYSVTATVNGCTSPAATTSATVKAVPAAPSAGNNGPICAGATLQLTASTIAGASYSWTGPNGFTSTQQNPTIASATTAASGTYSVTATVNGCTSALATTNTTVKPVPAAPTAGNNGPICAGATLQLTASAITGASYAWTGPNGFTSTQQNPTIASATTAASGIYTVTATVNGCASPAATTSATVKAVPTAPTAGNNGPICAGATLQLTASTITGASYAWTGPNGFTSTQQNPTIASVAAANAGTYSVTITVNGCTSAPATTSVTLKPVPSPPTAGNNGPICAGGTLQLTASTITGASYSWTGPNGFTSTQQNPTIASATTAASGTYRVTATVNGCASTPSTTVVAVNPLPSAMITAPSAVCPLSIGNAASVPDAGAGATYSWTVVNGTITSGAATPSIAFTAGNSGSLTLTVTVSQANGCSSTASRTLAIQSNCAALRFHTVTPCRVLDTRRPAGPFGGPPLAANTDRSFAIVGSCGIPGTARAVSANLTVTQPSQQGDLRLYPGGTPLPLVSSINYRGGQTRANNAVLVLGASGDIAVRCVQGSGTVHFILDVNGYFE